MGVFYEANGEALWFPLPTINSSIPRKGLTAHSSKKSLPFELLSVARFFLPWAVPGIRKQAEFVERRRKASGGRA
jgi:hypothetical protein